MTGGVLEPFREAAALSSVRRPSGSGGEGDACGRFAMTRRQR
jgi:hypothetical protein